MSLENIRSECSEVAALLQPFVDGELGDDEQKSVAEHLEGCDACRAAVSEQMWVRATLRSLEREAAPPGLRAGVLAALDAADAEGDRDSTAPETRDPQPSSTDAPIPIERGRRGGRLGDLLRGGLVMVPAAAVAGGLFFVARGGLEPVESLPNPGLSAAMTRAKTPSNEEPPQPAVARVEDMGLDEIQPQLSFPLQVAPSQAEENVELVGARLDNAGQAHLGARLRYRVAGDRHVVDRQRPIGGPAPAGTTVVFRGHPYTVVDDGAGTPTLHFELGGVSHQLTLEGGTTASLDVGSPDFAVLLDLAHELGRDAGRPAMRP